MKRKITANQGIEELFELYADDIYRYARYAGPPSTDAKDIVQEVFLRAYKMWGSFRHDASARTWLFQIARNYIYDLLRKKRTERDYLERHKPDLTDVSVPLNTLLELEDIVSRLKPDGRQVFSLRVVQDLSIEDTASILGWSHAKVKTTLRRTLLELRQFLEESELNLQRKDEDYDRARQKQRI